MAKVGIVVGGYVAAFAIAALVVRVYTGATSTIDRQAYSGMSAFGDSLVFLGALGVAAVPATGLALFFLRSQQRFWTVLGVGSLVVACTAVAALALAIGPHSAGSRLAPWAMAAPLRILIAPLFALFFLLAGVFAPERSARRCLVGASALEAIAFVATVFTWWRSTR